MSWCVPGISGAGPVIDVAVSGLRGLAPVASWYSSDSSGIGLMSGSQDCHLAMSWCVSCRLTMVSGSFCVVINAFQPYRAVEFLCSMLVKEVLKSARSVASMSFLCSASISRRLVFALNVRSLILSMYSECINSWALKWCRRCS